MDSKYSPVCLIFEKNYGCVIFSGTRDKCNAFRARNHLGNILDENSSMKLISGYTGQFMVASKSPKGFNCVFVDTKRNCSDAIDNLRMDRKNKLIEYTITSLDLKTGDNIFYKEIDDKFKPII